MLRAISLLLMGAVPAGVITYAFLLPNVGTGATAASREAVPDSMPAALERRTSAVSSTPALAAFEAMAEIESATELEARLARALGEPYSLARDAEIDALFARLASLDLERALRFADSPGFDDELVADLFRVWAEQDANAALQALASIVSPALQQRAALAMLDALGADAAERIAAALPDHQRIDFQGEALARRARTDPQGALAAALSFSDPAARNSAAQRVGMAWARSDPHTAYARAARLPPELQAAYRGTVATEWVHLDTAGFLRFADSQSTLSDLLPAMMSAMALDAEGIFEVTARHPPLGVGEGFGANITVERTAFSAIVQQDSRRALSLVEAMPAGERRQTLLVAYAETYGRTWPDEAIQWVRGLQPPAPELEATVIWSTALLDIDKALTLYEGFNPTAATANSSANARLLASPEVIAANIAVFAAADPRRSEIADRLRARSDDPRAQSVLRRMTTIWVQTDPGGALDWLLSTDQGVEPALVANVAGQFAARDARAAAEYTDRMPPELRRAWFEQVALPYASQDPQGAVDWIARFQGEPGYDNVLQRVVQVAAQRDPLNAAGMLSIAPPDLQRTTAPAIASAMARESLSGAARWAVGLSDAQARTAAVNQVAGAWALRDSRAAQNWALSLPPGDARDGALAAILSQVAREGFEIDSRLMQAFGSDAASQRAIMGSLLPLASRDPARANALLQEYVTDPELRRQAEQMLARQRPAGL